MQTERRTALMFAAKNGVFSIVTLLLKYKPDVSIKDSVSYYYTIGYYGPWQEYCEFYRATKLHSNWQQLPRFDTVSEWIL